MSREKLQERRNWAPGYRKRYLAQYDYFNKQTPPKILPGETTDVFQLSGMSPLAIHRLKRKAIKQTHYQPKTLKNRILELNIQQRIPIDYPQEGDYVPPERRDRIEAIEEYKRQAHIQDPILKESSGIWQEGYDRRMKQRADPVDFLNYKRYLEARVRELTKHRTFLTDDERYVFLPHYKKELEEINTYDHE
jgi:hypothetical protein